MKFRPYRDLMLQMLSVIALASDVMAGQQNSKPTAADRSGAEEESLPSSEGQHVNEIIEDAFKKLQRKELVSRVMYKPDDCVVVSERGDDMHVHYTGYLANGEIFDSSVKAGKDPISFKLGGGQVIPGWDQGLLGMCEGEKRRLIVPPELGYGKSGYPPVIPGDATLLFETTLVHLKKKGHVGGIEDLLQHSQLLALVITPAVISYVFYYMYQRYKEDVLAAKIKKHQSGGRKSRKRK